MEIINEEEYRRRITILSLSALAHPQTIEVEIETFVALYGERSRQLVTNALSWLIKEIEKGRLPSNMDHYEFIQDLINHRANDVK